MIIGASFVALIDFPQYCIELAIVFHIFQTLSCLAIRYHVENMLIWLRHVEIVLWSTCLLFSGANLIAQSIYPNTTPLYIAYLFFGISIAGLYKAFLVRRFYRWLLVSHNALINGQLDIQ